MSRFAHSRRKSSCVTNRGVPPAEYPAHSVSCRGAGKQWHPCSGHGWWKGYPCSRKGSGGTHVLVLTRVPFFLKAPEPRDYGTPQKDEQGYPQPPVDGQSENITFPRTSYAVIMCNEGFRRTEWLLSLV